MELLTLVINIPSSGGVDNKVPQLHATQSELLEFEYYSIILQDKEVNSRAVAQQYIYGTWENDSYIYIVSSQFILTSFSSIKRVSMDSYECSTIIITFYLLSLFVLEIVSLKST